MNNTYVNWYYHPTTIYINIFGNVYRINFGSPRVIDRYDVMKSLMYRRARVFNLMGTPRTIITRQRNEIYLNPQIYRSFSRDNFRRLANLNGYFQCTTINRMMRNAAELSRQRDEIIRTYRSVPLNQEEMWAEINSRIDPLIDLQPGRRDGLPPVAESMPSPFSGPRGQTRRFELQEERLRREGRAKSVIQFRRNFIQAIEIDCRINA